MARKKARTVSDKSVRITPDLLKRVKLYAVRGDTKISEVVNLAVADYLKRKGA